MRELSLHRIFSDSERTQGVLMDADGPFSVTLENPWLLNRPNVSCIPLGTYFCTRIVSPNFGETFEVTGVNERTHILFHSGNTARDTRGCILPGAYFGRLHEHHAVLNSRKAFKIFMGRLDSVNEFTLTITEAKYD